MLQNSETTTGYRTLESIVRHVDGLKAVRRADLAFGDRVLVTTAHSTYTIHVLDEDLYSVSGGWFDRNGLSRSRIGISGCTWGGSTIKVDIIAACGLHLEFGNRVVTSRIREFQVLRCEDQLTQ